MLEWFLSIAIWLLLVIIFPFIVLAAIYRYLISIIVPAFNSGVDRIVCAVDDKFLCGDSTQELMMQIAYALAGDIPLTDILQSFESKIIQKVNKEGRPTRPQLQQYPVKLFGFYFWHWDKTFDIKHHIRLFDENVLWNKKTKNVDDIMRVLDSTPEFVKNRSPWELLLVPNFEDSPVHGSESSSKYTGTLVILRAHHALGDGASFGELFQDLFDGTQKRVLPAVSKRKTFSFKMFKTWFLAPWKYCIELNQLKELRRASLEYQTGKSSICHANTSITPRIPIEQIKKIQKMQNVSFSAVILALVAKAYAKFLLNAKIDVPNQIVCNLPRAVLHKPRVTGLLTNHVTVIYVVLPLDDDNYFEKAEMLVKKESQSTNPIVTFDTQKILALLPKSLITKMSQLIFDNLIILSNVSLAEGDMRFQGANKVKTVFALCQSQGGMFGAFLCLSIGCNDTIRITFHVDNEIIPKGILGADILVQHFLDELDSASGIR